MAHTAKSFDRMLAKARKKRERDERKKSATSKPALPQAQKHRRQSDPDRFYLCQLWRELRYLALRNCGGKCQCCGASASDGVQLHVDHIKPRSMFPELALKLENLQVLCADCNIGKGAWDITDWREQWDGMTPAERVRAVCG